MNRAAAVPTPAPIAREGTLLLADVGRDPSWTAHRARLGPVPELDVATLAAWTDETQLRGRGGAGFPFSRKLTTAARRRALVVVNASEGEPASHKDEVLVTRVPHLVLDGAVVTARALGTREVHVVVPSARPAMVQAMAAAVRERRKGGERVRWHLHHADDRFVAGQARAVLELMAGRENKPVTAWAPEAVSGHRGRPTLLSNAETFAHVAAVSRLGPKAYAAYGNPSTPGTVLLTLDGDSSAPEVLEAPGGSRLVEALATRWLPGMPVLLGGYHGTWLTGTDVETARLDRDALAASGFALGAGVVLPLAQGICPVARTSAIVTYLAGESAGRCGPCRFGLPTMAAELERVARGGGNEERLLELAGVVTGRGACAHPDGTARLVRSLLDRFPVEVAHHLEGRCDWAGARRAHAPRPLPQQVTVLPRSGR
ncbi:MAG: NADH-ubiquinone oxidoreductase-F iron-sulfur binding region domain-containing protein [Angustibacter sp.]